jgi:thioredoxin 1
MKPHFDLFSKKYKSINFYQLDVDELEEVANKIGVSALPSFYVYQNGTIVDSLIGVSM